jgi:hypothetical protein
MRLTRFRDVLAGLAVGAAVFGVLVPAFAGQAIPRAAPAASFTVPAYCRSSAAGERIYPLNAPAGDTYWRSGSHGHGGRIRCVYFAFGGLTGGTQYGKWLIVDQAQNGFAVPPGPGVDVTYVNCDPPLRFPPPPFTGTNDCAESWSTSEGAWLFVSGPSKGQPMMPSATP